MDSQIITSINHCLNSRKNALLSGLAATARVFFYQELFRSKTGKSLCLVSTEEKAYDLARGLGSFMETNRIFLFLGREFVFQKDNFTAAEIQRMAALQDCLLHPSRNSVIIATPASFMFKLPSPTRMKERVLYLETGNEIDFDLILRKLVDNGYCRAETISSPGEFAVRGGVLDIFPLGEKCPYRLEFFGDLLESIRMFDIDSQRSFKKASSIHIYQADEFCSDALHAALFDYLKDPLLVIDEMNEFCKGLDLSIKRYRESIREAKKDGKVIKTLECLEVREFEKMLEKYPAVYHSFFPANNHGIQAGLIEHIAQKEMEFFYHDYERVFKRLKDWKKKGYQIQVAIKSKAGGEQFARDLSDHHITGVEILNKTVESGFISQTLKFAMLSEKDIWGKKIRKELKKAGRKENKLVLENLKMGDYVVHESYGIGIFRGVTQVETDNVTREYILLQYAGTDKLYLPLEKLDVLYMYNTSQEKQPRLSKLGGSEWERTKSRVAQSIQEMAENLLVLYARRQAMEGYAFSHDTPWQKQFEDSFPYQETPDQMQAILDVKRDMEKGRPMDRLICGDVGYGKTEVAMRAAFKAVMDGKQVAVMVPTTVLSEQHFQTFQERFRQYPVSIEVLSRFRSSGEQKKIVGDLKKGAIDIVIGTHRLLSKDVQFKDLGLLIVDEEHRFGVSQKEKIKSFKEMVDVVSLSATPIPRSLHMSLTGLRDFSVIETPPPDRYPVKTYVMEYNEEIIIEAVQGEIERNGQVFFVHNRIEDIYEFRKKLQKIMPDVSIGVGHGRMKEEELSHIVNEFLQGRFQLFLCTTIIESGLDMPNVNTIIIDEADKMGLAQLYQLRGRVGRSNRIAYAYLTYHRDKAINEMAQKRLNAIREFNELGAGMKIALRDLEIRGAGNILGPEQHGYIQAVGFDMYCRLLEKETAKLKGKRAAEKVSPQIDIDMDYYIPDNYIPDAGTKIRIYRRLLLAEENAEVEEIREELLDRFGKLPEPVENFLSLILLRIAASSKAIKGLKRKGPKIEIELQKPLPVNIASRMPNIKNAQVSGNVLTLNLEGKASLDGIQQLIHLL